MSVRTHAGGPSLSSSRLYDVLRTGLTARPPPSQPVHTSDGALVGYAELHTEGVYVFTSPDQLKGVRVHPPFRVATSPREGLVAGLTEVLSGALGR